MQSMIDSPVQKQGGAAQEVEQQNDSDAPQSRAQPGPSKPAGQGAKPGPRSRSLGQRWTDFQLAFSRRRIPQVRVAGTFARLEVMLRAGIPLVPALRAIARQEDMLVYWGVLVRVADSVSEGKTLSSVLQGYPQIFPSFAVAMIRHGELTGGLEGACRDIAQVMERDAALRARIQRAAQYPAFVTATAFLCAFALFRWVLPGMMGSVNGPQTPLIGRLVALGASLANDPLFLLISALLGALAAWRIRVFLSKPEGKASVERFFLRLPITGKLSSQVAQVRIARCISAQLRSGVMLLAALKLSAEVCSSVTWQRHLANAAQALSKGKTLASALQAEQAPHSQVLVGLVRAGEESGNLDRMLERAAGMLEAEVEYLLEGLVQLVEPALIAAAGLATTLLLLGVITTLQSNLQFS